MSNSHGLDPLRLRQLRAMAGNLSSLANWHREHHNYVVADALYTRSLSITEQINGAGMMGTLSVPDSELGSKLLRNAARRRSDPEKSPLGRVQKVG